MLGRTISHYRISSQLGAGGMGVVYAAEDVRLGRPVALKFVPEELAKDAVAVERLRAEARAASALNHASICTVYDVGEFEGRPFIVMEFLKGRTLRDALSAGSLKILQVVDIGIQVADALDAAHTQGILHRDIKPANLFLVDRGVVKILDFGLAKHLPQEGPSNTTVAPAPGLMTAEGVTVGTVSYMSPEQVTGEQLDARTDLFSLGIVLYECATGRRPFTGKTSAVILSAILNQSPVAPVVFNPQIPPRLQDVINNCLEKDRELRYQDAAGLRADLKRIRRDLESGHSEALRAVTVHTTGEGRTVRKSGQQTAAAVSDAAAPAHRRAPATWVAAAVTLAVIGVVALASFRLWPRSPASPAVPAAENATTATTQRVNGPLELAVGSLRAGNYREALESAEEVLRQAPDNAEAREVRDKARETIARFDEAIVKGNRLIASGDADGATAALRVAREIDPRAPAVVELSERILAQYRAQAVPSRQAGGQPRTPEPPSTPRRATSDERASEKRTAPSIPEQPGGPVAVVPAATPSDVTPPPAAAPPPPAALPSTAPPPASVPSAAAQPANAPSPAPSAASAGTASAPAARSPEPDDDALIRRVVDNWARAIESKDLALYRSVKPNLSADEQRRIEEGFRAVSSQRVAVTILRIERRGQGQQAVVSLSRRDTFVAAGRQQTNETQQTLTMVRSDSGWVISEIGR